jgi:AraC-like DNA-binding protein
MQPSLQLLTDSLRVRFLHIKQYRLDYTWAIPLRKLEPTVLWYLREGSCSLTVDGQTYKGEAGDVLLIRGGSSFHCRGLATATTIVSVNLEAEVSFLSHRSWTELLHVPVKPAVDTTELVPLLDRMLHTAAAATPGQALLQQADLLRIIGLLLDQLYVAGGSYPEELRPVTDRRIQSVIEYIARHPAQCPSLRQLAELAGVSESHVRKLFMRETGLAPMSFVQRLKINHAKRLLQETGERISDIAYQLGYEDANYFARIFKKLSGYAPADFRRRYQDWMSGEPLHKSP